jgi:hypothetical protein
VLIIRSRGRETVPSEPAFRGLPGIMTLVEFELGVCIGLIKFESLVHEVESITGRTNSPASKRDNISANAQ